MPDWNARTGAGAVDGVAGQLHIGDLARLQLGFDQRQHAGELREQQDAPALVDQFGHHLHQPFELGRALHLARLRHFQKARIAADLAQLQQRVEEDDVALGEALFGDFIAHPGVHERAHRLVKVALGAVQPDMLDDLGLGRQLGRHLLFRPPQEERLQAAATGKPARPRRHASRSACGRSGGRLLSSPEQARAEELKQRPHFAQIVFQRRAGQRQPVTRIDAVSDGGNGRFRILDRLRLVEDRGMELLGQQRLEIAGEQRIGGEHDIVPGHLGEPSLALQATQRQHRKLAAQSAPLRPASSAERWSAKR